MMIYRVYNFARAVQEEEGGIVVVLMIKIMRGLVRFTALPVLSLRIE